MGYFMVQSPMIDSQVYKHGNAQMVQFSSRPTGNTIKIKMELFRSS